MRITFVQPAMGRGRHKYVRSWQMQPLSIAALAGATPAEHEVAFFDDRLEPIAFDRPTDLAAITVETYTARRAYQIAREYRRRGVPVVMGGYHATLVPDEVAGEADAVVLSDGEASWPGLLADLRRGALRKRYDGRSSPGPVAVAPRREIFSGKPYLPLGLVESGRGCRFSCDFCAVTAFSRATYRARPVKDVARELEAAGHRQVFIVDDNLTADIERTKALLRELVPLRLRWVGQASIHVAEDPELLDLLEKSGCAVLLVGFESIDRDCLRAMNKAFNRGADALEVAVRRLRDKGVKLYATFVFGYDTDAPDVFERTLDFAMQQRFFVAAFNALQPFPGTPLYRRLEQEGRLVYDRWWLEPGYRFGTVAYRPRTMEPEALYVTLMEMRRRFFSFRSIAWRGLDLQANARGLGSAGLHLLVNHLLRRELDEKWRMPLGDVTEDLPASTVPSVRARPAGGA
jgi:radical SAM superfamily enzyme YgiQ (UPF0313 family)